jgi:hypothetical protein
MDAMGYIGLFFVLAFLGREKKTKNNQRFHAVRFYPENLWMWAMTPPTGGRCDPAHGHHGL